MGKLYFSIKLSFLIVLLISTIIFAQWELQSSGVNVNLNDVCFVDTLHGWAIGDSATIIATSDGGATWRRQRSPVSSLDFNKVCFVNKNVGYLVGENGIILSTRDGGINWLLNTSGVDFSLTDLAFVNEDTGWVVGSDVNNSRKKSIILNTQNGGNSWGKQLETYSSNFLTSRLFHAIAFRDDKIGWALASDYVDNFSLTYIYQTTNAGENWNIISIVDSPLFEMRIASADTIWAGGFVFAQSYDGGVNWHYTGGNYAFGFVWDFLALDGKRGWVGARSLLFTEDGMRTWADVLPDKIFPLHAIASGGKNNLWAVGESGIIAKYTFPITQVTYGDQPKIPEKDKLYQNYPNPFNPMTTIEYDLPEASNVTISIYNIQGRLVANLVNEHQQPGHHYITWHAGNQPSGIYLYKMQTDHFSAVRKLMLIK